MPSSPRDHDYPSPRYLSYRLWHKYLRIADSIAWPKLTTKYPIGTWDDWGDPNKEPVDVLIPAIEKDLSILPLVVESLRKNFAHTIQEIYIISPFSTRIKDFCGTESCSFIDESDIDCRRPIDINYIYHGLDRSKWLYQQLLKLSNQIGKSSWFFVCDADTVLLRRTPFRLDDQTLFYKLSYIHLPYRYQYLRLLGHRSMSPLSFVSHMMMFKREHLRNFGQSIEQRHGQRWDDAIIATLNKNEKSSFSEYESYGTFVCQTGSAKILPAYNTEPLRDTTSDLNSLLSKTSKHFATASFHAWKSSA